MIRRKSTKTERSTARPFGLLAAAVFAISAAGAPIQVFAADNRSAVEESDAKIDKLVSPLLKEAIALYQKGKYEEALKKCDAADKIFATTKHLPSPQITAQKSMFAQFRSEIQTKWGRILMERLKKNYDEARRYAEKQNEAKAIPLFKAVIADAEKYAAMLPAIKAEALNIRNAARQSLSNDGLKFRNFSQAETARRSKLFADRVDPLIKEAQSLFQQNLYKKAYEKTLDASKALEALKLADSPQTFTKKSQIIALRREIVQKWETIYIIHCRQNYLKAVEMASKNTKEALSLLRSALASVVEAKSELPVSSEALLEIEAACNRLIKSGEFIAATSLEETDVVLERRRKDINDLIVRGEALYRNKMYSKARDVFEQVYILDPFNEKANVILGKIYRKINETAWMRRENEILERINEVEWKWVLPSRAVDVDTEESSPVEDDNTSEKASIFRKLQEIIYPGADFEDESVADVLSQIMRRSRELDPDKKGINIVYPVFKEDKFVTLKMGKLPIGELIRYICMYTGLKYKVTHLGVEVGESNLDDMTEQTFTMTNTLYDNIMGTNVGDVPDLLAEDASDNPFEDEGDGKKPAAAAAPAAGGEGGDSGSNETLKNFFVECGVPFGEGASVSYNKRANKLTVRNTPENLKIMANLIKKIDIDTKLILVEAKIIEIAVSDLEELGFDWTLTHNNTDPEFLFGNATQVNSSFGSQETFALGEAVINQVLVRHTGGTGGGANFSTEEATSALNLINNLNIIPNFGKDGAYNMFLTVHAVDQSSRGEVIAAPKVLAKSGTPATIQMVQQMYFPEEWEDAELEEANNTFEYTPPVPEMGEATPIGTNFTVTPTIGTNLRTITMVLAPSITALVGWTDYDYQFIIGSIRSVNSDSATYAAKMKMPEISERSLTTQLKVYDGDTVVLGGVLQENSMKRDDKYPFLGDIPLFGTLFSNRASRATKQNLLIFVTPRLVGYNGVPVNAVPDNGRFDFNR